MRRGAPAARERINGDLGIFYRFDLDDRRA